MPLKLMERRRSEKAIRILDSWFPPEIQEDPEAIERMRDTMGKVLHVRRGRRRILRTVDDQKIRAYALGQRLREFRLERGMRQEDMAKKCGMARPNITRLERGTHLPSMKTLHRLTDALHIPLSLLLERPPVTRSRKDKALAEAGLEGWSAYLDKEDRR